VGGEGKRSGRWDNGWLFSLLSSILTASGLRNIAQFIERWVLGKWRGGRFDFSDMLGMVCPTQIGKN